MGMASGYGEQAAGVASGSGWNIISDLPTVPGFPGLSRKLSFCPGVPETYRMSRDRLPTGFVFRHPFRYMISILETLQRWASEGSHTQYCAICRMFN